MLKLTKKADYALMAMKHLAEHADEGACSAKDVADSYDIPLEALAKILQRLVKAGLLHSQHGMNGGYTLAREGRTISAFEVIQAIEGPLFITSCVTVRGECVQPIVAQSRAAAQSEREYRGSAERIKISHMTEEPETVEIRATKPAELVTIS